MNKYLLAAAVLLLTLTACDKKEEVTSPLPLPATQPSLAPAGNTAVNPENAAKLPEPPAQESPANTPPAPASTENTGSR